MMGKGEMNNTTDKIEVVLWDWNGTLLNDVDCCIRSINQLLLDRNLPCITTEKYKQTFTFPVINYYNEIGFDFKKESFETVSVEFMEGYFGNFNYAKLSPHAIAVLNSLKDKGIQQYILSAMKQDDLEKTVFRFGIRSYFNGIFGASDHYANGKIGLARKIFTDNGFSPDHTILIGDTLHDEEVARELDIGCILFSGGHFSKDRLLSAGNRIVDSLQELIALVQISDEGI